MSFQKKIGIFFFIAAAAMTIASWNNWNLYFLAGLLLIIVMGAAAYKTASKHHKRMLYLEGSLDAVQLPITVTDMDMNWVFINKVTESLLTMQNLDKKSCIGKHCSSWKADICGTDKCGIASLRKGQPRTNYNQQYPDKPSTYMQVDTSYIEDDHGNPMGHVEIVTNIDAEHRLQGMMSSVAASLEESSASLEELSSVTKNTAEMSSKADGLMGETSKKVDQSQGNMEALTDSMAEITKASEETSKIIKTIDEIAFQTNLLALNAAVEAARAGEAGAGFAVVADEVRNLALRAAEAARNTAELIEGTVKKIKSGHSLVETNNSEFAGISNKIGDVAKMFADIASASQEQALGIEQLNQAIRQIEGSILDANEVALEKDNANVKKRLPEQAAPKLVGSGNREAGSDQVVLLADDSDFTDF